MRLHYSVGIVGALIRGLNRGNGCLASMTGSQYECIMDIRGKHFIPARVLGSIDVRRGLVHSVSDTDTAVRVHTSESIVLDQFRLHKDTNTLYKALQWSQEICPIN